MRKVVGILLSAVLTAGIVAGCGSTSQPDGGDGQGDQTRVLQVGITQIAEHPALDAAREGIIEGLKEAGFEDGKQIKIEFESAQGDPSIAQQIAQKFVSDKKDLIITLGTMSSQAVVNLTSEIPVVFSAVTDPVTAGLVADLEKPGANVTGVSDLVPVKDQLALFQQLGDQYKRIGIIYNAGEDNSDFLVKESRKAAQELGLELVETTVANASEVQQAAQSLVGRVDAIYLITDNTVAQAVQSVIAVANQNKIPTLASVESYVEQGALITLGLDYRDLGRQTGRLAAEILQGKNPGDLPVQYVENVKLIVNTTTAQTLGLTLPEEMLKDAVQVN
ncbi:MAG TPA: ABC transporter substrate-binding protein [Symbiobacteriaceae bacterium]